MPIAGLTDRTPSFREVGRLRLGIPKAQAQKSGPKEIGYFRADFRPDEPEAYAAFVAAYEGQPTRINFRLPFTEIHRCWDAMYEVYNTSGLLGMADGERWLYLRNSKTGEVLVKDGSPYMAFNKTEPVYAYKSRKGEEVAVFAKPTGRLKIVIPELKRAAFVVMITHSVYNIMRISEQLAGIEVLARNMNTTIAMIPMVLSRTKETISVSFDGKKQYQERFLVNIEVSPLWAGAQFDLLDRMLPGVIVPEFPALPSEVEEVDEESDLAEEYDETEGKFLIEPPPNYDEEVPAEEEKPVTTPTNRPYPPSVLKERIATMASRITDKATDRDRSVLAKQLQTLADGDDTKRYEFCGWLFGEPSTKKIPDGMILAGLAWLGVKDFGDIPNGFALGEYKAAASEALKEQGQLGLGV